MLSHFFNSLVATLPLAVRNSGGVAVFVRILWVATLLTMSICAGVVVSVAFQQVDGSPDAEAGTEGDDEGLENADLWQNNAQVQVQGNCLCLIALPDGYTIPENVLALG